MNKRQFRRFSLAILATMLVACSPPTEKELLAEAQAALESGQLRTASIHLKNLLRTSPNNVEARALLGRVALAGGDPSEAEHNLRAALDLGAAPVPLQLPLLHALLAQGKYSAVLAQIGSGPKLEGADRVAVLNIEGSAQHGLKALDKAEAAYRAAIEIDPKAATSKIELAGVLFESGRISQARDLVGKVAAERPNFAPALLLLGSMEAAAARYDESERLFRKVLELQDKQRGPQYALALSQLTETFIARHRIAEASEHVDQLLALTPQSPVARVLKARIEIEQQKFDSAERRLENVIGDSPGYWPAYLLLGLANASQNKLGQAEMYLRRAANTNPKDTRAQLLLAELYMRQNDVNRARNVLDTSAAASDGVFLALAGRASLEAGQTALASEYFERSVKTQPTSLRTLIDMSSVFVAAGELDRAVRLLESAALDEPDSQRLANYLLTLVQLRRGNLTAADSTARRLTEPRPESLNLRGTIAMMQKRYDRARDLYSQALEQRAEYVPALLNLARVSLLQGDKDQTAVYLRQVIQIDPNQINALLGMAQLAAERGDDAEADTWLKRAPESVLRYRVAGELHLARRRFEEATDEFALAFDIRPSAELALRHFRAATAAGRAQPDSLLHAWEKDHPRDVPVNFALGTLALEHGELDAAVARYSTVLDVDPKHFGALNNLAWIYGERGDDRALGLAGRAYELQPRDASVADTLGWLHVRRGNVDAGRPLLERAVRDAPDQPEIQYHWAVVLAKTGDEKTARDVLTKLLAGGRAFQSRPDAQELLSRIEGTKP